ncbi:MAG: RusA family crossover junction endodeoxyribonuclease [Patescibacteria group bacterium]|nr:RusA family crossover junction endodeoxyribonuclease [Patescibacteria group bacterium]
MSEPIIIRITGFPVAQRRPGLAVVAGHAVAFKRKVSRTWEQDARQVARVEMGARKPLQGCLALDLTSEMPPAASWPAWKREAALEGRIRPTGTPDLDNLFKAAQDALNGVVWLDDAQIVEVSGRKRYGPQPFLSIMVRVLEGAAPSQINAKKHLPGT